ncbi:MAG: hypothetical protein ACI8U4_002710 [Natronomonas sp.]|jgi:hypothetical protein
MRRVTLVVLGLSVALSLFTGVGAAETMVGGTVVIESGETVTDVTATGGEVVVRGTVDGDLRAYGGDVHIAEGGEVTGIVRAYGGDVRIDGTVQGNALVYAGNTTLGETGTVDRSFGAVGSSVTIAGNVGADANVVAGSITLTDSAVVGGSLNYYGTLRDQGGTVEGGIQNADDLALGPPTEAIVFGFIGFMLLADLILGAILLRIAPDFADAATDTVATEPLYTLGIGLAAAIGVVLAVVVLTITIIGLPFAVALLMLALVAGWFARVYGQYTVAAAVLGRAGVENRYLALVVGVVGVTLLGLVPYVGPVLAALVYLVGAGIVVLGLRSGYDLITRNPRPLSHL